MTRWVIGSWPARSTVTMSPRRASAAGISRTSATAPAGMAGLIDPVLNRMSPTGKTSAVTAPTMHSEPATAASVSSAFPARGSIPRISSTPP
ncbi:hypothetical protein [Leifsonia xyli]|nr:hypothetical protein [Leifsonia xyli]